MCIQLDHFGKAAALPFYIAGRFHLEISRLSLFYEEGYSMTNEEMMSRLDERMAAEQQKYLSLIHI